MLPAFSETPPVLWIIVATLVVVDIFLLRQLLNRWQQYTQARHWPRLTVKADNVQLVRVAYEREGSPTSRQEYYEAVFDFRYQVAGRDYQKQTVQQVATQQEADAIKAEAKISFLYNPADPAQTIDAPPGPAAVIGTVIGLLIFNSIMFGLLANVQDFFNMDTY